MEYAEALWEYAATSENELSFPQGAQILVLRKFTADWWEGQYNGKVGYFPSAYARVAAAGGTHWPPEETERLRERISWSTHSTARRFGSAHHPTQAPRQRRLQ